MIESGRFPLVFLVASFTLFSKTALMRIVFTMAGRTVSGYFFFEQCGLVASQALHSLVLTHQLEFSLRIMIEPD